MKRVDGRQRRDRIAACHHHGATARSVREVVDALAALHATDPATPHLGVSVRAVGAAPDAIEQDLYVDRSLWRLHAMRRTLFIVRYDDVPVVMAAVTRDVATRERARLRRLLEAGRSERAASKLLEGAEQEALELLAEGQWRAQELSAAHGTLATAVELGSGRWRSTASLASRLMVVLAAELKVVRARPVGSWLSGQYRWARSDVWFGREPPSPPDEPTARAELARRYVGAFGPITEDDLRWWTGWSVRRTRDALEAADLDAVELEDGSRGFVVGDGCVGSEKPAVALLPALDPTPMGYRQRSFFGGDDPALYDANGNVGPTVWVQGRIVGTWAQDPDGRVVVELRQPVDGQARERVDARARELEAALDGVRVTPRFRTPLERRLSEGTR